MKLTKSWVIHYQDFSRTLTKHICGQCVNEEVLVILVLQKFQRKSPRYPGILDIKSQVILENPVVKDKSPSNPRIILMSLNFSWLPLGQYQDSQDSQEYPRISQHLGLFSAGAGQFNSTANCNAPGAFIRKYWYIIS